MIQGGEIGRTIFMIGQRFSRILIRKQAEAGLDQDTIMYGRILVYILDHEEETIYQKDLESFTGLNKSTISMILTNLVHRGYVIRENVDADARLRRIRITENGRGICEAIKDAIRAADTVYEDGLTEEEQRELQRLLLKISQNISEMEENLNL